MHFLYFEDGNANNTSLEAKLNGFAPATDAMKRSTRQGHQGDRKVVHSESVMGRICMKVVITASLNLPTSRLAGYHIA